MNFKNCCSNVCCGVVHSALSACAPSEKTIPGWRSGSDAKDGGKAITCLFYEDVWANYLYEVTMHLRSHRITVNMEYYPFDQFQLVSKAQFRQHGLRVIHVDVPMVYLY